MTREKKPNTLGKRRNPRIDTSNMISYVLFDRKKDRIGYGKGHTINLSLSGTLLRTQHKLEGAFIVLMAIDLNGNKIKVQGKVVRSLTCKKTGYHLTGIEFIGPENKQREAIVAFVKAYQRERHSALKGRMAECI